ncbi:hypothetical protein CP49_37945 [Bradyrhizobium valentinum]|uniref:Uncharacterized protein n=1 Tax=Bradyrhizobium valentinum TaxID=1518501 RepID=A0A0R3KVM0_9BRAD|nr:hypothetical protein CP49_37945 [Bradyrhizobium valentinum]
MAMAPIVTARYYLNELWQAIDQFGIHVVTAEFDRTVFLAVDSLPNVLVASRPIRDALKACQRLLENRPTVDAESARREEILSDCTRRRSLKTQIGCFGFSPILWDYRALWTLVEQRPHGLGNIFRASASRMLLIPEPEALTAISAVDGKVLRRVACNHLTNQVALEALA